MENLAAGSTHSRQQSDELPAHSDELEAGHDGVLGARLERLTEIADQQRGAMSAELLGQLYVMAERVGRDPAIERAKLVLRQRYAITGGEAFQMLRHVSQTSNRKVRDVARDVLANLGEP